jgi:Domain of unknown function (DUF4118)
MATDRIPLRVPPTPTTTAQSGWARTVEAGYRVRPVALVLLAVGAPIALAAALLPWRGTIPSATVVLGLAVLVSIVAAVGTRFTAAIAAVSAALSFDGFFTEPYGSLSISRPGDIETTALLLVGGLVVGQLSARNREHRRRVSQSRDTLARIQAVAELLAAGTDGHEVVAAIAVELREMLHLSDCWFDASFPTAIGPVVERNGDVSWGRIWWGFDTLGLPGKQITVRVDHQHQHIGRFVLVAEPGTRVSHQQLLAAVTLADQAGTALGAERVSA